LARGCRTSTGRSGSRRCLTMLHRSGCSATSLPSARTPSGSCGCWSLNAPDLPSQLRRPRLRNRFTKQGGDHSSAATKPIATTPSAMKTQVQAGRGCGPRTCRAARTFRSIGFGRLSDGWPIASLEIRDSRSQAAAGSSASAVLPERALCVPVSRSCSRCPSSRQDRGPGPIRRGLVISGVLCWDSSASSSTT
jgi:hypothetical protein